MGLPASVRICALAWSRIISWSSSGMPSSALITFIGICAPRSATKSNRPAPTSGSRLCAQYSRILGSSALILRGVNIRASSLRWMSWIGGSSKITVARRNVDVGLDQFHDRAARRAEGFVVHQRLVHVGEPAERVEVVLLVVVQRLLFAEPTEHRVRIGVEFYVVRVEVDILHSRVLSTDRHGVASRWIQGLVRHMPLICLTTLASATRGCQ